MRLSGDKKFASNRELWLFFLVTALHLAPLFTLHFFPTVDGAAHTYNASVIKGLITGNTLYENFYEFNKVAEPNWLGHAVIVLLNFVFSSFISEKIFLAICIVAIPLAFRQLVICINPKAVYVSYLIFPFVYSFMFITGFYNFCLSLPLLFWAIRYWMNIQDTLRPLQVIKFALLMLLLYFCHIMAFGLMGLIAGFLLLSRAKQGLPLLAKRIPLLLLAALPGLLLTWIFIAHHHSSEEGVHFPVRMLLGWIKSMQPIMTYDYADITIYAHIVFWMLIALKIVAIAYRIIKKQLIIKADMWLLISIVLLAGYFFLPDSSSGGGYISIRLLFYFYVFHILWMAAHDLPKWAVTGAAIIAVTASLAFVVHFHDQWQREDAEAQEYHSLAANIEAGSIVLPLDYSNDWRHSHYSNLLAYEKPMIILENYEASSELFPVIWKQGLEPYKLLGDIVSKPPCLNIGSYAPRTGKQIDYIVQWKYLSSSDSCASRLDEAIEKNYTVIKTSSAGNAILLKRKTAPAN